MAKARDAALGNSSTDDSEPKPERRRGGSADAVWAWARTQGGTFTSEEAAKACGITQNNCSRIIAAFRKNGLMETLADPGPRDGRFPVAHHVVTPEGMALVSLPAVVTLQTRWQTERAKMLAAVTANRLKAQAAVTGKPLSQEHRCRLSEVRRGVKKGGRMKADESNMFAKDYALCDPDGYVYRGRNIRQFVRDHPELFDARDLVWKKGDCNAARNLDRLRRGPAVSWKGWTWQW